MMGVTYIYLWQRMGAPETESSAEPRPNEGVHHVQKYVQKAVPKVRDAWILAHAIVETIREPLIVLDQDLRVVAASRSFYLTFKVNTDDTEGKLLYDLGDGQWDIPKLRLLLRKIVPSREPWKISKSSMISPASAGARCS
jgi:hypothetical protein